MSVAETLLLVTWLVGMVPMFFVTIMAGEPITSPGERSAQVAIVLFWPFAVALGIGYMILAPMFGWEE